MTYALGQADIDALRDASGASAVALIGLAQVGPDLCVADSLVAAPPAWELTWPALDVWSASALLDLTLAWENLDAQRFQPLPIDVLRHGRVYCPAPAYRHPERRWGAGYKTSRACWA